MPNSLQGLNIVYPPPRPSNNPSQDLLTPPPGFPDLSAQLDLWTNLSFASDEPFVDKHSKEVHNGLAILDPKLTEGDEGKVVHEINEQGLIVNADKLIQTTTDNGILHNHEGSNDANGAQSSFDLGSFLAGFGIDPFLVPPQPSVGVQSDLLSFPPLTKSSTSSLSPSDISTPTVADTDGETQPPAKRSRTRKDSIASHVPAIAPSALQQSLARSERAVSEFSEDHDPLTTPLTASEDKRRRNTAASARFRAKKKEREQALETRSKELETRVTELERECEGLRRENGWLKGLVVGVTGGNPSGVPNVSVDGDASRNEPTKGKRKRDAETAEER